MIHLTRPSHRIKKSTNYDIESTKDAVKCQNLRFDYGIIIQFKLGKYLITFGLQIDEIMKSAKMYFL